MSTIAEVRARHQNLAQVLKDHVGIRKIVEDLYPDQAHFIYELLQNAQDTGASNVSFNLRRDRLTFEHDGRPFSPGDVAAITDIGESNKVDEDKIGRFGVGFKAVFAYSEIPTIHSPTYSFRIDELVLPTEVAPLDGLGQLTRFLFPFNNPKKEAQVAFDEIAIGLSQLSEMALLFLPSLGSISWSIEAGPRGELLRIQHSDEHLEILRQSDDGQAASAHFLRFDAPVEGLGNQNVSIAFPLNFVGDRTTYSPSKPLAGQLRIVPADPGQVAVFFPAEKETSGLRFHLHAPFVPELSRASIKETAANGPLFDQLAALAAASLHSIRDLGLLTADFLAALPNPQDPIPPRYRCVRTAITNAMDNEPLTPTHGRSHAPARRLLQARASLKELLTADDLEFLVEYEAEPPLWAISAAQKNSNADRLLSGLAIKDYELENFIARLQALDPDLTWKYPDQDLQAWLAAKPAEWHQQFYALLHREMGIDEDLSTVEDLEIVRLKSGDYCRGSGSYFGSEIDSDDDGFPRVDPAVYTVGRSKPQQAAARKLLEGLGTRDVGEAELVEALLKERYAKTEHRPRIGDMKRFVALLESDPTKASLFASHYIFEDEQGSWRPPMWVFLDQPLKETGLATFFSKAGIKSAPVRLASRYPDGGVSPTRFLKFAEAVGVVSSLKVTRRRCDLNPRYAYLRSVGGERWTSPINEDYFLEGFEAATAAPDWIVSALLWRTADLATAKFLQATFQINQRHGAHFAPSSWVFQMRKAAWIPQTDGRFVLPADARSDLLPPGFPFDAGKKWLKAIGFGEAVAKRSEEAKQKQTIAKQLGFEDGIALEDAQWFAALDPQERQNFKDEMESRRNFVLPEHEPSNPDRRAERVGAMASEAPERLTEERTRSVSIGLPAVKQEADQYLRQQYTNADGEMICQVCKGPLPFRLEDGRYYVEKVELVRGVDRRHHQNYLALCPNHAAMVQHAHGSQDLVRDLLLECDGNTLEVILAGSDETIYFTGTHLLDLKAII